jgi:hypothetical protein
MGDTMARLTSSGRMLMTGWPQLLHHTLRHWQKYVQHDGQLGLGPWRFPNQMPLTAVVSRLCSLQSQLQQQHGQQQLQQPQPQLQHGSRMVTYSGAPLNLALIFSTADGLRPRRTPLLL